MPKLYAKDERPHHPFLDTYAHTVDYDSHFTSEADVKRAIAGYSGLVSAMDENVGYVLRALRNTGLEHETRVIYTSDHGDNVGARGLWGKSTLYEESAGVPLILAGPDVPPGRVVATPASHIDCAPTILEGTGLPPRVGGRALPGASLCALASGAMPQRPVISEYHATGSVAGAYMLRFGQWKYCHYVGARPQLFDLDADPEELADVADDPTIRCNARPRRAAAARRARSGSDRHAREAAAGGTADAIRRAREGAGTRRPGLHASAWHSGRDQLAAS